MIHCNYYSHLAIFFYANLRRYKLWQQPEFLL
uniref:Uncharacterized protein n=1 Tax=virus sp. ctFlR8 TaxID=2825811 RepID=A0A8S5RN36_9VIRU|nr:MAG TPA: hypothetical protein [virus sp. ctFlR8]